MANIYFKFKQFTVWHDRCAMKVGTDGVLLGAWAAGGAHILDIGTGTGLVALMMAQRFKNASVTAIEIDRMAAGQAQENVDHSPFKERMRVVAGDVCDWAENNGYHSFDAIVCNPPFFVDALKNPDAKRAMARHAGSLTFPRLMQVGASLLSAQGSFSLIIPADMKNLVEAEAYLAGLFLNECCMVKTNGNKLPKRCLMRFSKQKVEQVFLQTTVLEEPPGARSPWYQSLTSEFYL